MQALTSKRDFLRGQAFQGELQAAQQRASELEESVNTLTAENSSLRQALTDREQQVAELGDKHQVCVHVRVCAHMLLCKSAHAHGDPGKTCGLFGG